MIVTNQTASIRVLHLITTLEYGGTQNALYHLLSAIDSRHFESQVIFLAEPDDMRTPIANLGIPVKSLAMRRGWPSLMALKNLVSQIYAFQPHILQTWLYHADLLGLLAGRLAGGPNIFWNLRASDMDMTHYRRLSGWTRRTCAALSRWPQVVVINSQAGRRFHDAIGYHPRRWELIPNGVDTQRFRPDPTARQALRSELGLKANILLVGYVARFDPMKDHAAFFQAARQLVDAHPDVRFVLCGGGITWDNLALVSMIEALELRPWIHLLGPRQDVERVTAALDLATSASRSEGFPNTIAEAMACAVPCAATDVGDSAEIIAETGVLVPSDDATGLAAGWAKLIEMGDDSRERMGAAARERIVANFSLQKMASAYEQLYKQTTAAS
jgi:glycosyltransferase involved in cell wall biosynthesis